MFGRLYASLHLLIFFWGLSAYAAPAVTPANDWTLFKGKKIEAIEVEGLKRIEKDAVTQKITTKTGQIFDRGQISADIQTLFSMGYFDDIEVRGDSAGEGAFKLIYRFKERPVISKIEFDGNERVKTDDLKGAIKVKEWSILDFNKVKEDTAIIQKYYEDKGFYLTKVAYEVKPIKDDEVELVYKINDYDKIQIKKITFLNNKRFSDERLKQVFQETREGGFFSFVSSSGNFRESGFKQDLQRLTYYYLDNGYVKFKYETPVITVSDDKRWLYISIYVDEGDQYSIGKLDFSGDLLFTKDELHSDLTMLESQQFSISKRNDDIQKLTEKYQDLGYAFVNVVPKMDIKDDTKIVDLDYSFEKGNLVHFGEIIVLGNTKTHDKVIRRELRVHEGELYSGSKLRISKENVERLGFFAPGEVVFNTISPKGKPDIVNLEVTVKERSTGSVTVGAGYGSIQKFFFTTQISEINLFGRGQNVSLAMQYSTNRLAQSFNFSFTEPYTFDTRWSSGFDLFYVVFPIPNRFLTRRTGGNVRIGRWISDYTQAFLTYKHENMKITDKTDASIDESLDRGLLSSAVLGLVRDKRNNRFETTGGNYQSASVEYAGLGGDKFFTKWILNNRFYHRVVGDLVFRNMTEVGQIIKVSTKDTPPSERFFLGGPNNMKSYQIFSLTPIQRTATGYPEPIGGSYEFLTLAELEYPIIKEAGLKWVTFYDLGNTWKELKADRLILRQGYGFGVRWFSPIGPLRFEWGFPIHAKAGEQSPVFQFFIGPPF